jgi:hypothetical protein
MFINKRQITAQKDEESECKKDPSVVMKQRERIVKWGGSWPRLYTSRRARGTKGKREAWV